MSACVRKGAFMRKNHLPLFLILFLSIIAMTSCVSETNEDIDPNKYTGSQETLSERDYLYSIGDTWLTPETRYSLDTANDSIIGIQRIGAGNLGMDLTYQNKIFFTTAGEQGTLYMYLDPVTGEAFPMCPDPLCSHTERDRCPYMTIVSVLPDNTAEDGKLFVANTVLYDEGHPPYDVISEYTEDGMLKRIYGKPNLKTEEGYSIYNGFEIQSFCVYRNTIYCTERYDYTSGGAAVETQRFFRVIDGTTGELIYTCDRDDISGDLIHVTDTNMLFDDPKEKCCYITDLEMKDPRIVFSYTVSASITYDANTEEYYTSTSN